MRPYRDLFAVPGVRPLAGAMLLARLGGSMWAVALVLYVLQRFHSPGLAGLVGTAGFLPGVLVSPLAGALLDRHGRVPLVIVDYVVGAVTALVLALLAHSPLLTPGLLMTLAALSSLTLPLGMTGGRSLLPLLTPRALWDRVNAVDAGIYRLSNIVGPGLAGVVVGWLGAPAALAIIACLWLAASFVILPVKEPRLGGAGGAGGAGGSHVLVDAWAGLRYVLGNRVLRNLAVTLPIANFANGLQVIVVPVIVLGRLHGGAPLVGALYSALGLAGLVTNVLAGSMRMEGRESRVMALCLLGNAAGFLGVAFAPSFALAMAGMVVAGASTGPFDVAMFGLRQRAVDPAWFGRALSISMSLNSIGMPIGSAVAGPVLLLGGTGAMVVVATAAAVAAGYSAVALRVRAAAAAAGDGGSVAGAWGRPEPGSAIRALDTADAGRAAVIAGPEQGRVEVEASQGSVQAVLPG